MNPGLQQQFNKEGDREPSSEKEEGRGILVNIQQFVLLAPTQGTRAGAFDHHPACLDCPLDRILGTALGAMIAAFALQLGLRLGYIGANMMVLGFLLGSVLSAGIGVSLLAKERTQCINAVA